MTLDEVLALYAVMLRPNGQGYGPVSYEAMRLLVGELRRFRNNPEKDRREDELIQRALWAQALRWSQRASNPEPDVPTGKRGLQRYFLYRDADPWQLVSVDCQRLVAPVKPWEMSPWEVEQVCLAGSDQDALRLLGCRRAEA